MCIIFVSFHYEIYDVNKQMTNRIKNKKINEERKRDGIVILEKRKFLSLIFFM